MPEIELDGEIGGDVLNRQPDGNNAAPESVEPKIKKQRTRVTDAEYLQRVTIVYDWLIAGLSRAEIFQNATKPRNPVKFPPWEVTEWQIDRYIASATAALEKNAITHRDREFGKALARLNKLYSIATRVQDIKSALLIQKEISQMLNLHNHVAKIEITHDGNVSLDVRNMTTEQLRALVESTDSAAGAAHESKNTDLTDKNNLDEYGGS